MLTYFTNDINSYQVLVTDMIRELNCPSGKMHLHLPAAKH